MIIQKIRNSDVDTIYNLGYSEEHFKIGNNTASRFWTRTQLEKWIESDQDVLLKSTINNNIVGFILTQIHYPTRKAILENLFVQSEFRNQKIATELLSMAIKELLSKKVEYFVAYTNIENTPIHSFFKKQHFENGGNFIWQHTFLYDSD